MSLKNVLKVGVIAAAAYFTGGAALGAFGGAGAAGAAGAAAAGETILGAGLGFTGTSVTALSASQSFAGLSAVTAGAGSTSLFSSIAAGAEALWSSSMTPMLLSGGMSLVSGYMQTQSAARQMEEYQRMQASLIESMNASDTEAAALALQDVYRQKDSAASAFDVRIDDDDESTAILRKTLGGA